MNTGDFTKNSTNWVTNTWKARSFERCATRLVFHEPNRVIVFVALLHAALSSVMDASPQSNAPSAVLESRTSFSILGCVLSESTNLCILRSGQMWRECPTARCGGDLASVEHARMQVVPSGAKDGYWKPS